jgi:hypothetical protein
MPFYPSSIGKLNSVDFTVMEAPAMRIGFRVYSTSE